MAHSSTDHPHPVRRLAVAVYTTLLLAAAAAAVRAEPLGIIPEPPLITPAEAGAHVGEVVDLDATVAEAKAEPGRVVLHTAGDGGEPVRIVIVRALVGPSSAALVARYAGQRVRVRGRIDDFAGEREILVSDPGVVVVIGGEDAPEPIALPIPDPDPEPAAPQPTVLAPRATELPPPVPTAPVAAPAAAEVNDDCRAAQRTWSDVADAARAPVTRLASCLDAARPPCAAVAADVRRALAELAAAEERLRWVCAEDVR